MQFGKFISQFIMIFILLMIIVWLGTAFDNKMTFTWYSYTIVGILSTFYAWTKSVDMNQISGKEQSEGKAPHQKQRTHTHSTPASVNTTGDYHIHHHSTKH